MEALLWLLTETVRFQICWSTSTRTQINPPPYPSNHIILIILVIEHIAITKNFGKEYRYHVVPSQEIIAQGTANLLGPFPGGYARTGSFGASAVLSKAGVRTPLTGLFSALILLLALYAIIAVFYYIPRTALAGLIIHAV